MKSSSLSPAAGIAAISLAFCGLLCGCGSAGGGSSSGGGTSSPSTAISGTVHEGRQLVAGATVVLWAAGVTGTGASNYGANAIRIASATSSSLGAFSFVNGSGGLPCTAGQYLYVTASGGNAGSGTNNALALMAAIPAPCGSATAATGVWVNEVTTVAAVTALQQFMSIATGYTPPYSGTGNPPWTIGAPSTNTTGLANAFLQVGNLVDVSTGTSASFNTTGTVTNYAVTPNKSETYTLTVEPPSAKIDTLADILAACASTSSVCPGLMADTTPNYIAGTTPSPSDTIQSMYYLATNPGGLTMRTGGQASSPYHLCVTYIVSLTPPFLPGTCANYNDWALLVQWYGGADANTTQSATIALDAGGNVWVAQSSPNNINSTNAIEEFNQSGNLLIYPPATAAIAGYSPSSFAIGDTHQNVGTPQIAIDLKGNAWYSAWNGGIDLTVGANSEGVLIQVNPAGSAAPGVATGYLAPYDEGVVVVDPSGNLFLGGAENTGYYTAEYTPAYSGTNVTGVTYVGSAYQTGSANYAGNNVVNQVVSTNANALVNYVWTPGYPCSSTISGSTAAAMQRAANDTWNPGPSASPAVAISLPAQDCVMFIATDSYGNLWGALNTLPGYIEYIDINPSHGGSLLRPVVTQFAGGTTASGLGGLSKPGMPAIDGAGNLWVGNDCDQQEEGGVSEFVPSLNTGTGVMSLTALSPSTNPAAGRQVCGFGTTPGSANFTETGGIVIDSSGNVWAATTNSDYLDYFVGIAAPVVTPVVAAVKNAVIGVRP